MAVGDGITPLAGILNSSDGEDLGILGELNINQEQVLRYHEQEQLRREQTKRLRELEFARTSNPKTFLDDSDTTWTYVVVEESLVRIIKCETSNQLLRIPEYIDGYPVFALGSDACSENPSLIEIECPDSIESIGSYAFRNNRNLKKISFPKTLTEYQSSWLRDCSALEELVLPGMLEVLPFSVFDNPDLKCLRIGQGLREIQPGAFEKTSLERLVIDEKNPYLKTDGVGIYTSDGSVLVALGRPAENYSIAEGCETIAKKACNGIKALRYIKAPSSLQIIGEFAFAHSGLITFEAPENLSVISEKAFFYCSDLHSVVLNEGLRELGNSCFAQTSLEALHIPGSIERIGFSVTEKTNVIHAGANTTLTLDSSSTNLFIYNGGLYSRESDGIYMIQLMDREATEYAVFPGTDVIDHHAFAFHSSLRSVIIPDGVSKLGDSSFRYCTCLEHVELPDSIREIGSEAFIDTILKEIRIPRSLEILGKNSLVTWGAHHGDKKPSLEWIEVAQGNDRFFVTSGMLCRQDSDSVSIIIFTSSERSVIFPEDTVSVADYAFNNARDIEYLAINKNLRSIGSAGLTTWCWIPHIHVETKEPIEGRSAFDIFFPDTPKSIHGISLGIGGASWVNVPGLYSQFDNCVINAHDYNSPRNPDSISIYDQVHLVIDRLRDPILLTQVNRNMYDRLLRIHLIEICVDIARHDDRDALNQLVEWGYVNEENLESVISEVGKLQDAAMTGFLLEIKRLRFNKSAIDFDL